MQSEVWGYRDRSTLLQLRERYGVNILQLAEMSGVSPAVVYCMLLSRPVSRSKALSVLRGLSALVGAAYSLDNVDVNLSEDICEYGDW